jgi:hypothetical protein
MSIAKNETIPVAANCASAIRACLVMLKLMGTTVFFVTLRYGVRCNAQAIVRLIHALDSLLQLVVPSNISREIAESSTTSMVLAKKLE